MSCVELRWALFTWPFVCRVCAHLRAACGVGDEQRGATGPASSRVSHGAGTLQLTGVPILRCRVMAVVVRFLLQEFNAEKQALVNQVAELQLEAQAFSAEVGRLQLRLLILSPPFPPYKSTGCP